MRRVKIASKNQAVYASLDALINEHIYVGFECHGLRYMVCAAGSARGLAVSPEGTWSTATGQESYTEGYYIFETKNELLEWMKA